MVSVMRPTLMFATMVTWSAAPLAVAEAQQPTDELTPRAIADSTYAVRVEVDGLLEAMRRGQLDLRRFNDPQLAAAVGTLAAAGGKRSRRSPHQDLGVLWDLQINLSDFQSVGRDVLQVRADVFLAAAPDSGRAPVTLTLRRESDRWNLTEHKGLVARLIAIATALGTRGRP